MEISQEVKKLLELILDHYEETNQVEYRREEFNALLIDLYGFNMERKVNPRMAYLKGKGIIGTTKRQRKEYVILFPEKLKSECKKADITVSDKINQITEEPTPPLTHTNNSDR